MAWDFSTEPEFEEKLEWMRGFVREEVFPLETLDLTYDQVRILIRPLQERVKAEGLWAAHLPAALGGIEEGRGLDRRVELRRLGAEVAVLGTAPGLGRQDSLDLHFGPTPGQPHLVGQ